MKDHRNASMSKSFLNSTEVTNVKEQAIQLENPDRNTQLKQHKDLLSKETEEIKNSSIGFKVRHPQSSTIVNQTIDGR